MQKISKWIRAGEICQKVNVKIDDEVDVSRTERKKDGMTVLNFSAVKTNDQNENKHTPGNSNSKHFTFWTKKIIGNLALS